MNGGNSGSAGSLALRGCVGKGAFPEPEKADSQNLDIEAPRDSVGLAGEGTEFSLMSWGFVFQIS